MKAVQEQAVWYFHKSCDGWKVRGRARCVKLPGVYLIYADDSCLYVGSSLVDVNKRACRFINPNYKYTVNERYLEDKLKLCSQKEIIIFYVENPINVRMEERFIIQRFCPIFNVQNKKRF